MILRISLLCSSMFVLAGCDQLSRVDDEPGGAMGLPPAVATVIAESCTGRAGCHAPGDGVAGVTLDPGGSFVGGPQGIVIAGDIETSRMAVRIQDPDNPMPPADTLALSDDGRLVLLGWIASGAELVAGEGAGETDAGGSDTSDTSDPTAEEESSSEGGGGRDPSEYDEFVPVLEIFQANCGGAACHRDGGPLAPQLDDEVAYDNIVGVSGAGGVYVEPEDAAGSFLVHRIEASMGTTIMPPASNDPLSQDDIDVITSWIDNGANL